MPRSEERFSRNAETELVCRLLLEKKKRLRASSLELPAILAIGLRLFIVRPQSQAAKDDGFTRSSELAARSSAYDQRLPLATAPSILRPPLPPVPLRIPLLPSCSADRG